jgi:hypothetical protein
MAKITGRGKPRSNETNIDVLGLEMGKRPPQAVDIEEAVLGALMLEPSAVPDVLDIISPDCFYKETNKKTRTLSAFLFCIYFAITLITRQQIDSLGDFLFSFFLGKGFAAVNVRKNILLTRSLERCPSGFDLNDKLTALLSVIGF